MYTFSDARLDNDIYSDFEQTFPELASSDDAIRKIDEDAMKSPAGKEKWRNFIMKYEKTVADYNFGTLIRTDASDEYTQDNTIFCHVQKMVLCCVYSYDSSVLMSLPKF